MKYYLKYHASSLVISMLFSVGALAADNLSCSGPFGKLPPEERLKDIPRILRKLRDEGKFG
jgi:hypothetical protein